MIKNIIDFCSRNIFVVFTITGLAMIWAIWSIRNTPIDALPDISDTQVIIFTEWKGRSPDIIEDQISYPIITTFIAAPKVKIVRGFTIFGLSFIFVIFEDGTDMYWARSRTIEYLSNISGSLPPDVTPELGPDATSVGWIYEYALVDETGKHNLQELRTFQDWYLRYWLESVPGVSEIAGVGGYQKQYQVEIDPVKLQAYDLWIPDVIRAIRQSNNDVGGRVVELAEHEFVVRGRGYITETSMLEKVVVGTDKRGTPILLRDIARVQLGGNIRRGLAELDGEGEAVGGIVVMRYGENALTVINGIKEKFKQMAKAFPEGVKAVATYDRSELIKKSMNTLTEALIEEIFLVSLVIIMFLFHFWSALVSIITLVIAVAIAFIPMYYMNLTTNIMSLAGIIIAIGDVVDAAMVMTENAHRKLELNNNEQSHTEIVIEAAKEIGPSLFGGLLVTVVAFIPVFTLQAEEGRLFSPLAFTKTFSVLFGALLGITLVPALMVIFIRGKIRPAMKNPVNRLCIAAYKPVLGFCVHYRHLVVVGSLILVALTVPLFLKLGSEFMPPLDEGDIFFMPIVTPGISIETGKNLLQRQDKIIKHFPEVERVFGKIGRADTSTDPAPLSMIETIIRLKHKSEWRPGMTKEKLLKEMNEALTLPGVQNAFTMPIKARFDMLATGIRTTIGIKIYGDDLEKINAIGLEIEHALRDVPGTRSVFSTRETGGFYIDFIPDREACARYGLNVEDVFLIVETSIGGMDIDTTIEGLERYTINVRYARELRHDVERLEDILVPIKSSSPQGEHVPLSMLGEIKTVMGPTQIKDEMASLTGWVYVDTLESDIGGYVARLKKVVDEKVSKLPVGYWLEWTGQYENLERMQKLMRITVPLTLILILIILFFNFGGLIQTLLVMLSVPFATTGAIWFMYSLNYNTSVAVWVGLIALFGIAAQTASIMVVYLEEGFDLWSQKGKIKSKKDLVNMAIEHGASRVRPLLMAVGLNIFGLVPIIFSTDIGSDVAKRIAAPLYGGLISLTLSTLLVIPAVYVIWRGLKLPAELKKKIE